MGGVFFLDVCPVSGEEINEKEGDFVTYNYKGREIRLCCRGCVRKMSKDPEKYIKKIDEKMIKIQKEWYPLDTCLVSGEPLKGGDMGDPIDYLYGNRLVRFCCQNCIARFEKDPVAYMEKLDAAVIEKQTEKYPLDACIVSGEALDGMGEPVNFIVGNRLFRLCCQACVEKIEKQPVKYMALLRNAYKKTGKDEG